MRFLPLLIATGLGVAFGFYWLFAQLPEPDSAGTTQLRSTGGKWVAVAGDRVQLDAIVMQLQGLSCPAMTTDAGKAAQQALSEILESGQVDCQVLDTKTARCSVAGRDLSDALIAAGLCQPA